MLLSMSSDFLASMRILLEPFEYLINPQKRIFWLYLLSSALIAVFVIKSRGGALRFWRFGAWYNRSGRLDVQWILVNHVARVLLLVPVLGGQVSFALACNRLLVEWFGAGNFLVLPTLSTAVLFTISLFVWDDFSRYCVHYFYHKIPFLWRFHAVHHSATTMTPLTLYRIHTVEMVINSLRNLCVTGTISGVFIYVFDGAITTIDVLGASIFNVLFNLAGANLRHSHVWLGFGWFEKWFISPAQHQIHHSTARRHHDKNFGAGLAIWDRVFSTWVASRDETVDRFGLSHDDSDHSIVRQVWGLRPSRKKWSGVVTSPTK